MGKKSNLGLCIGNVCPKLPLTLDAFGAGSHADDSPVLHGLVSCEDDSGKDRPSRMKYRQDVVRILVETLQRDQSWALAVIPYFYILKNAIFFNFY